MKTYSKAEVIRLVRDELRMTNKALKLKTEFDGLTDSDWQYIGVIASALQEPASTGARIGKQYPKQVAALNDEL
jgi:hypothetical protein